MPSRGNRTARSRPNATIGQVAQAAGVGIGTVSRVMNETGSVSPATRARVLEVMRRFEYRPHAGARSLARNASRAVGFVMANRASMHLYNVTTLNGVLAACAGSAYSVVYTHFDYGPTADSAALTLPPMILERGGTDGLVLVGINHRNLLERLSYLRIPFVLHHAGFSGEVTGLRGGDVVSMEDAGGMDKAATHLITLGHRRISFIGDLRLPWFRRRYEGYLAALHRAGLPPRVECVDGPGDNFECGLRSAESLLQRLDSCTAIMAGDDLVMLGVLDTLRRRGLSVPYDMSLVGFGDTQEIRYQQTPALSTVHAPRFEIGQEMVRLLLSRLVNPRLPLRSSVLKTELVLRDSCAPPRSAQRGR